MTNRNKLSFPDIEYAWSNNDQIVFFIPKEQYTDENIKKFNEAKKNNEYLAIATNVYEIKDYDADILTLAFYQHGYYDCLLKGDYQVMPYKRTYLGKEMSYKMTLGEFKQNFTYNERRLKLYDDFIKCLSVIKNVISINTIKVGGSFVEDKESPGDLDFVIYISEKEYERIKNDKKLYQQYQILTFPYLLRKYGLELDVRIFAEKEIDLKSDVIYSEDEIIKYFCQRGYCASLNTNCYEMDNKCYLHNFVSICD